MALDGRKKAVGIGAALLAVLVLAGIWRSRQSHEAPAPQVAQRAPVTVEAFTASQTEVPVFLTATGTVQAQYSAPVATRMQGRVLRVPVREGERVRKGQLLVELDARDLDAAVRQADANLDAARVGHDSARVTADMEDGMSSARIRQAEAAVRNAEAAVQGARAKRDMVLSGPRLQEKTQASLAVAQARSGLDLARKNLERMRVLQSEGAISRQQLDIYQTQHEVAEAQLNSALQAESLSTEGSREEDVRAAREGLAQAEAGLNQARAALAEAQSGARVADVRRQQIRGAQAQVGQGQAALEMARVTRDYASLRAPFDGVVAKRLADPGSLASPGVPLLVLEGGALQVRSVVPETNLASVRLGTLVPVTLDATGTGTQGRVVEISPQGDPSSHTFVVKVNVAPSAGAKSGMFARVRFPQGRQKALLVPGSAVVTRDGLSYVFTEQGGNARLRLVTLGPPVAGRQQVISGLAPGERVLTDSSGLEDGVPVVTASEA